MSNLALTALIARESTVHTFAAFALVFPIYSVAQRFTRAYLLIPRQIDLNSAGRAKGSPVPLNPSVVLACGFSVLMLIPAYFVGSEFQTWIYILSASLPGLILYDGIRNEYLSRSAFGRVFALDFGWLVGQGVLAGFALAIAGSAAWQMVAWGAPPLLMALALWGIKWRDVRFSIPDGLTVVWGMRHVFADSATALLQALLTAQVLPYVVAGLASFKAVAALRAGQTLMGPINVSVLALVPLVQMSVARRLPNRSRVLSTVHSGTVWIGVLCACYTVVLLLIPDGLGTQIFGKTWPYAALMILPLGFHVIGKMPFSVVTGAMRAIDCRGPLVRIRIFSSLLLLVGAAVGSLLSNRGIEWIPWAMFIAGAAGSIWLYFVFRARLRTGLVATDDDSALPDVSDRSLE